MLGGLLCERRHSEATPAMKPPKKLSAAAIGIPSSPLCPVPGPNQCAGAGPSISPCPVIHPSSVPLPLLFCSASPSPHQIVLKNGVKKEEKAEWVEEKEWERTEEEEEEDAIAYSGQCIRIGGGGGAARYEFWDRPSSLVGRGSYGVVFRGVRPPQSQEKGEDSNNNNNKAPPPVAIKRMWRMNVRPDELEAMKRVRNENLVALLDVCDEPANDLSYLVMELCDTDLDRHLREATSGRVDRADDMRVLVRSVARGYFALFQQHIVHRDIKPQNILLVYDRQNNGNGKQRRIRCAKITDFGVSRVLADENGGSLCNVAGTLLFMAPEVGANLVAISEYDHSADMWSIGCLLFQCLAGRTPFDECSLCRIFLHCAGGNFEGYEMPELEVENAPETLEALICALLQIDRAKRATPAQLLEAAEAMP